MTSNSAISARAVLTHKKGHQEQTIKAKLSIAKIDKNKSFSFNPLKPFKYPLHFAISKGGA